MIKRILFFLLSLCFVAFGHPAWMPCLGPLAGALGYGLFWGSLDSISLAKSRFWAATGWFFIVQLIQMSWLPSVKYQGFYIVSVYLLLALGLGLQFGWITRFVFFRRALSIGSVVAIGAFATLNEWLRLFFLCGFTFNFSGMALACYVPSMQFASIFGVLGLSYVVFCVLCLWSCVLCVVCSKLWLVACVMCVMSCVLCPVCCVLYVMTLSGVRASRSWCCLR